MKYFSSSKYSVEPVFRYVTGGTLPPDSPSYIIRSCDAELLELCRRGDFAYVLSSRQMGKSSLMARTVAALQADGLTVAALDLTTIGSQQVMPESWYLGVLAEIDSACMPQTDLFSWWEAHQSLPLAQRLWRYITEVLLPEVPGRIVVLVDEIDSTLRLDFTDDFFALIRALHNQRAQQPEFNRISFVLLGVATPAELIRDPSRTPFNIGQRVEVTDFNTTEARPLLAGLGLVGEAAEALLARVLHWTGGQPYLTQKLCALLSAAGSKDAAQVDAVVAQELLSERGRGDPHFQFVADYLLKTPAELKGELFEVCSAVLRGRKVACLDTSLVHNRLRLAGLMRRVNGYLQWRNELYRRMFGLAWMHQHRPTFWTKTNLEFLFRGIGVSGFLMAAIIGFLYKESQQAYQEKLSALMLSATAQEEASRAIAAGEKASALASERQKAWLSAEESASNAKHEKLMALKAKAEADSLRELALAAQKDVLIQRILGDANNFFGGNQKQGIGVRSLLMTLAGHRLSQKSDADLVKIGAYEAIQTEAMVRSRLLQKIMEGHSKSVLSLSFDIKNNMLASGGNDNSIRLWDLTTGQLMLKPLEGHSDKIESLAFSPDGTTLASGSADYTVRLWDLRTGKIIGEPLHGVQNFSRESRRKPFSSYSDVPLENIGIKPIGMKMVVFGSDGKFVIGVDSGGSLYVWNTQTRQLISQPIKNLSDGIFDILAIDLNWDKKLLAIGRLNTIDLFNIETGLKIGSFLHNHDAGIIFIKFSPDGGSVVSSGGDKKLKFWGIHENKYVMISSQRYSANILHGSFDPDGKLFAGGGADNVVRLWDAKTGDLLDNQLQGHAGKVLSVEFSPDGKRIASGSDDMTVRLWGIPGDVDSYQTRMPTITNLVDVVFGQSEKSILINRGGEENWMMCDLRENECEDDLLGNISIKDKLFFVGQNGNISTDEVFGGSIRLSGPKTKGSLNFVPKNSDRTVSLALSWDGKVLASGDLKNVIQLWDIRTGKSIGQPVQKTISKKLIHPADSLAGVRSMVFSQNGKTLFAASKNPDNSEIQLRQWPVLEAWADMLCAKLPRNMSHKEWREWISPDIEYIKQCPDLPVPAD